MTERGMDFHSPVQTKPGGEQMEQQEITMGQVTYQVQRVYQGSRPIAELVADRMAQNIPSRRSVDEHPGKGL